MKPEFDSVVMNVREHGNWRFVDWLTIGIWVYLASVIPAFRRRYWGDIWTVSIWTNTLYGPKGRTPSAAMMRHELVHIAQAKRHGKVRFTLRYLLSARWRMWYEAEAYAADGRLVDQAVAAMRGWLYFCWWQPEQLRAFVEYWKEADLFG